MTYNFQVFYYTKFDDLVKKRSPVCHGFYCDLVRIIVNPSGVNSDKMTSPVLKVENHQNPSLKSCFKIWLRNDVSVLCWKMRLNLGIHTRTSYFF